MNCIVLTGDRPTGPLHLGHFIGSLQNRVALQHQHQQLIMVADIQALTVNFDNPKKVTSNTYEVIKDYLAVGIDPAKTIIFIQSQVTELSELMVYLLNLVTVNQLERNPTIKTESRQKGYEREIPMGFLCHPVSQAADITAFKAELVPVGEDQMPLIEQTNEIVRRFNRIYNTDVLKEAKGLLSSTPRLMGIDGKAKASKSLNNAIFLKDSPEDIRSKIFSMYTDPGHIKVSDPGRIEGNVVFSYLDAFYENTQELEELKASYQRGGLGDTTIKGLLNDTLQKMLSPIREKRASLTNEQVISIAEEGTYKARKMAHETLEQVKEAMGLLYF